MKLTLFVLACFCGNLVDAQSISLAGDWQFQVDRNDVGVQEQWFNKKLEDHISLPGSMLTNGKGDEVTINTQWTGSIYDSSWFFNPRMEKYRQPGNLKFPFWLTPAKYYKGAAWYRKEVVIPATWTKKSIELFLERCHTETMVWVDGKEAGMQNSLVAPHVYELAALSPGKHTITIRVDNRIKAVNVGPDSHSLTDHTQGNWNGIIGKIALEAKPLVKIENVQVYPDVAKKQARVVLNIKGVIGGVLKVTLAATAFNSKVPHVVPVVKETSGLVDSVTTWEVTLPMGNQVQLWDEFNPALYKLLVTLQGPNGDKAQKEVTFGMRSFRIVSTGFTINDRPVFLRGTVNNCEFPLTGFPPMDEASWIKLFTTAKAHGLNHMRFHSWCPPEAAFKAADITGFYLQPEGPGWVNHGTSLGDGKPIDKYMYEETDRMADWYGNYASFCMEAPGGNEPAGRNQVKYLTEMIHYWQAKDKRRVYTGASVGNSWPLVPENEYMVKAGARGLNWVNSAPESDSDYQAAIQKFNVPYVVHEMGQWCAFPDFNEIPRFNGVYKERNFELFRESLAEHGMANQANDFLMASGKLQVLCYKHEIEKAMRTKGLAGIQLLGLQDFPGQGTALVGMLNALWEDKPYATPKQVKRFCNAVVPLIRMPKFVYTGDEKLTARVELFNYGAHALNNAVINWAIKDSTGKILKKGTFDKKEYALGNCLPVGTIEYELSAIKRLPMQLNLDISIAGTEYGNDWNIWVFPPPLVDYAFSDDVYDCDTLDEKAISILNNGGTVFLHAAGKIQKGKEVVNYFTPVFWNTSWFKMRPPHTLGIVCDPKHPALKAFPATGYSDLQWWDIINKAQVMHLEDFPKGFKPILQPIDTWFINRKLALLLEAKVGKGKLLLSSIDLRGKGDSPAAQQLFTSLLNYVHSRSFNPATTVELSAIQALFTQPSRETWNGYTKDSPDELKPKVN